MPDTSFTIYKSNGNTVEADAAASAPSSSNRISRGETVSYEFRNLKTVLRIGQNESATIPASEDRTIDFVTVSGTLTIEGSLLCDELAIDGGTVDNNGTLSINETVALELEDLREYREFSGAFSVRETLTATQRFSESIDEARLDTLVVGIEPSADLQEQGIPGVWGLVESISDQRNPTLTTSAISIDIRVLAPFGEFSDVDDVTNNLKL